MRLIRNIVTIVLFLSALAEAQSPADTSDRRVTLAAAVELREPDSTQFAPQRHLLPANTSWMERDLWGETGLFRRVGIASLLTPETRKSELALRRTMLTAHQIGGFVTLALMGTTVYYGQKTIDNPTNRSYRSSHQTFVTATIVSYSATGLLAVLSPPPFIRREDEVSTTTIHKVLAWVHFTGMVVTPILGASLHRNFSGEQLTRFHQISGYFTVAALATSLVVVTF